MLRALTIAAVTAVALGGVAYASDADFKLANKTGYQIDEVYVSPASSQSWGSDIMGRDAVADGQVVNITFPHGGSACNFDIKVKYHDDGTLAEWNNINLCQYETISLYWDAKNQTTRAVGE